MTEAKDKEEVMKELLKEIPSHPYWDMYTVPSNLKKIQTAEDVKKYGKDAKAKLPAAAEESLIDQHLKQYPNAFDQSQYFTKQHLIYDLIQENKPNLIHPVSFPT